MINHARDNDNRSSQFDREARNVGAFKLDRPLLLVFNNGLGTEIKSQQLK
jgi:hypothetical protein